jgi:hypothetical protein
LAASFLVTWYDSGQAARIDGPSISTPIGGALRLHIRQRKAVEKRCNYWFYSTEPSEYDGIEILPYLFKHQVSRNVALKATGEF